MITERKIHIYSFLDYSGKYILLLPIPIISQILMGMNLLSSSTFVLCAILAFAFFKYRCISYSISSQVLTVKRNVIVKRKSQILIQNVILMRVSQSTVKKIFGVAKVDIKTNANKKKFDESLIISQSDASLLMRIILSNKKSFLVRKTTRIKALKKALISSNPLTGLLVLIPLVNRAGKILGSEIKKKLYYGENFKSTLVDIGIPSAVAWITYILLISWIISVITVYRNRLLSFDLLF